jgi:hypothetical protein
VLRAALDIAQQPIPSRLDQLHHQLQQWEGKERRIWPERDTMSAREVASRLDVTLQQVYQLGAKRRLVITERGRRGRGHSTLYTTESVRRYAENRPHPGRRSQSYSSGESL